MGMSFFQEIYLLWPED